MSETFQENRSTINQARLNCNSVSQAHDIETRVSAAPIRSLEAAALTLFGDERVEIAHYGAPLDGAPDSPVRLVCAGAQGFVIGNTLAPQTREAPDEMPGTARYIRWRSVRDLALKDIKGYREAQSREGQEWVQNATLALTLADTGEEVTLSVGPQSMVDPNINHQELEQVFAWVHAAWGTTP